MTKAEEKKMTRLEIENKELRTQLDKHFVVYREQLYELVDLRTRLELIQEAMHEPTSR
jgi:hypothetical protein